MRSLDAGENVLLVLLDLSAAFDTIDHDLLMKRLYSRCGVRGTVYKWFESYLKNRCQSVIINKQRSKPANLKCGVPQGSVLGPILFTIYTVPLGEIIRRHNVSYHIQWNLAFGAPQ